MSVGLTGPKHHLNAPSGSHLRSSELEGTWGRWLAQPGAGSPTDTFASPGTQCQSLLVSHDRQRSDESATPHVSLCMNARR